MTPPARFLLTTTLEWTIDNGEIVGDSTRTSEVVFLLKLRKGSAAAYPQWGSDLHKIVSLDSRAPALAETYARAALAPMLQDGRLRSVTVKAMVSGPALVVVVAFTDDTGKTGSVTVRS